MTVFLSTLSLRRATCTIRQSHCNHQISIHALLAESDYGRAAGIVVRDHFYPRSPCGERPACAVAFKLGQLFLSTLSLRRATALRLAASQSDQFLSTLSLRRATLALPVQRRISSNFYPRSPCGERLLPTYKEMEIRTFLSTLSLRRATHALLQGHFIVTISIHALLAESDTHIQKWVCIRFYFYPRSPCGERLSSWTFSTFTNRISIHALLAESDQVSAGAVAHGEGISIHALLAESDRPGPR